MLEAMEEKSWPEIKSEYVTTLISYRALAVKWGISPSTLGARATKEGWAAERKKYLDEVEARTVRQTARRRAKDNSDRLLALQRSADNIGRAIAALTDDTGRLEREAVLTAYGVKLIRELTAALKDLVSVTRNLYDLPTAQERHAMDVSALKLELEREKAGAPGEDEGGAGVVLLTEVLEEGEDAQERG